MKATQRSSGKLYRAFFSPLLLSLALFSLSAKAEKLSKGLDSPDEESFKHAFLSMAGPGNGPGVLGHAFIIFSNSEQDLSQAKAFQFAADEEVLRKKMEDQENNLINLIKAAQKVPLVLSESNALKFLKIYENEGRQSLLYPFKLPLHVIRDFYEEIVKYKDGIFDRHGKPVLYQILHSNCTSFLIRVLNQVLERHHYQKLDFVWDAEKDLSPSLLLTPSRNFILNGIPYTWISSLSDYSFLGEPQIYHSAPKKFSELYVEWIRYFNAVMGERNLLSASLIDAYVESFSQKVVRENKDFVVLLVRLLNDAKDSGDTLSANQKKNHRMLLALTKILAPKTILELPNQRKIKLRALD